MVTKEELIEDREKMIKGVREIEKMIAEKQQNIQVIIAEINKTDGKLELLEEIEKES